jgi:DNA-binding CsgD family transcriptional regulator
VQDAVFIITPNKKIAVKKIYREKHKGDVALTTKELKVIHLIRQQMSSNEMALELAITGKAVCVATKSQKN